MTTSRSFYYYTWSIVLCVILAFSAESSWRPIDIMGTVTDHNMDNPAPLRTVTDGMENPSGDVVLTYTRPYGFKALLENGLLTTRGLPLDEAGPTQGMFGADEAVHAVHKTVNETYKSLSSVSGHSQQVDSLSKASHRFSDHIEHKILFATHKEDQPVEETYYSQQDQAIYMTSEGAKNFILGARLGAHFGIDVALEELGGSTYHARLVHQSLAEWFAMKAMMRNGGFAQAMANNIRGNMNSAGAKLWEFFGDKLITPGHMGPIIDQNMPFPMEAYDPYVAAGSFSGLLYQTAAQVYIELNKRDSATRHMVHLEAAIETVSKLVLLATLEARTSKHHDVHLANIGYWMSHFAKAGVLPGMDIVDHKAIELAFKERGIRIAKDQHGLENVPNGKFAPSAHPMDTTLKYLRKIAGKYGAVVQSSPGLRRKSLIPNAAAPQAPKKERRKTVAFANTGEFGKIQRGVSIDTEAWQDDGAALSSVPSSKAEEQDVLEVQQDLEAERLEKKALEAKLDAMREELDALRLKMAGNESDAAGQLETLEATHFRQLEEDQKEKALLEENLRKTQQELEVLRLKMAGDVKASAAYLLEIEDMRETNSLLEVQLGVVKKNLVELEAKSSVDAKTGAAQHLQFEADQKEKALLEERLSRTRQELEALRRKMAGDTDSAAKHLLELEEVRKAKVALEAKLSAIEPDLDRAQVLQQKIVTQEKLILESQRALVVEKREKAQRELNGQKLLAERERARAQVLHDSSVIEHLRGSLASAQAKTQQFNQALQARDWEKDRMRQGLLESQQDRADLLGEINALQGALDRARSQVHDDHSVCYAFRAYMEKQAQKKAEYNGGNARVRYTYRRGDIVTTCSAHAVKKGRSLTTTSVLESGPLGG